MSESLKEAHTQTTKGFINRCKAFERRYELDFIPVTRDSQTKPWKKTTVSTDLIDFCESDDRRFDILAVSDTTT